MGYRCEVAIKCEEKAFDLFQKAWQKVNFKPDKVFTGNFNILYWARTKWDGNEERDGPIQDVMAYLNGLQDFTTTEKLVMGIILYF